MFNVFEDWWTSMEEIVGYGFEEDLSGGNVSSSFFYVRWIVNVIVNARIVYREKCPMTRERFCL